MRWSVIYSQAPLLPFVVDLLLARRYDIARY